MYKLQLFCDLILYHAMHVLMCFIYENRKQLDRFVADNFPSKSSEYKVGTPRHLDYICALNKVSMHHFLFVSQF